NIFREECAEINVAALKDFAAGSVVDAAALVAKGLVRKKLSSRIKLLGHGEIDAALTVHVHAATAGARRKIEAAGGKIELIGAPADEQR
ncbi:MAG TPA: uL15m family ribosomal protein, partial [Acidobacteriota bacterium]|nr:uL15m family ribosomal protein [Acidobacteriota bacterium]